MPTALGGITKVVVHQATKQALSISTSVIELELVSSTRPPTNTLFQFHKKLLLHLLHILHLLQILLSYFCSKPNFIQSYKNVSFNFPCNENKKVPGEEKVIK